MKRMMKLIGIIFILVLILLAALNISLKKYLNSSSFRNLIAQEVQKSTHRDISLGKITYSIFPPSIIVRDVILKEKDKQTDFVALQEFSLRVDIGKREITSLHLIKPSIRIVEYHDGSFNFSDMIPEPTNPIVSTNQHPETSPPTKETTDSPIELKETSLPLSIALVTIQDASLLLIKVSEEGEETSFSIPTMNLTIRDITLDKPILTELEMKIGNNSSLSAKTAIGPMRTLPPDIANMQIDMTGVFNLASFKDLEAFLTPKDMEQMPITSMNASWSGNGTLAHSFDFDLVLKTPPVQDRNKLHLNLDTHIKMSFPDYALNNILYSIPVPNELQPPAPPKHIPTNEVCLTTDPVLALILSSMTLQTHISTDLLVYEKNELHNIDIGISLKNGRLTLSPLSIKAFNGTITGQAGAQLTAFPLEYALESFNVNSIQAADVIAANPEVFKGGFLEGFSGTFDLNANLSGKGTSDKNIQQNLKAQGHLLLADGQSISTGGSFIDKLYLKLDNPILMQILPELQPKILQARINATNETVTKLENVVLDFDMQHGTANLTDFQAGTPDYLLKATGKANPFEDSLYLEAQVNLSSNVTMELTGGKDRSDRLPYENNGLIIPLIIKGTMTKPIPMPNLDKIIRTMARDETKSALTDALMKNTSEDDRKQINDGLNAVSEMLGISQADNTDSQSTTNASVVEKGMNLINNFFGGEK